MLLVTPAVALLLWVSPPSISPDPLPCPGSVLATPPSISGLGVLIGCTSLTTLSPKSAARGGPASPKRPSCWGSRPRASTPPHFPTQARV